MKLKENSIEEKAIWFDMLTVSKTMEYEIGRTKLLQLLRKNGYLMDGNIPYQRYVDSKHFKVELHPRKNKNGKIVQYHPVTVVSMIGIELIKKVVKKNKMTLADEAK